MTYHLLVLVSVLVVVAFLYELAARRWRIPSTLLLLATGVALRTALPPAMFPQLPLEHLLGISGSLGLILIVLEAGLDLDIVREKWRVIVSAFLSALGILVVSTLVVVAVLNPFLDTGLRETLLYALPLAVVSSAIVLPSVVRCEPRAKEFLVYEASFSDILGIMIFNTIAYKAVFGARTLALLPVEGLIVLGLSMLVSWGLVTLMRRLGGGARFTLLLALVTLLYAAGKFLNLSTLAVVLIAGISLNNLHLIPGTRGWEGVELREVVKILKAFIAEGSFLVRTIFFTLFGYSFDLAALNDLRALGIGLAVVGVLVVVRGLALRFVVHIPTLPGAFVSPRGLVTILLYYSIPESYRTAAFDEGILLFVIVATNLLNTAGIIFFPEPEEAPGERREHDGHP